MRFRLASFLVISAAGLSISSGCGGSAPKRAQDSTTPAAQQSVLAGTAAAGGTAAAAPAREAVMLESTAADDNDEGGAEGGEVAVVQGSTGGAPPPAPAPGPAPVAVAGQNASPNLKEQLVVEAWLSVQVENASETARALREVVEKSGGRITSEQVTGAAESWSASISMRLPPGNVGSVIDWLGSAGDITSKRIQGTDVSKTLFDQQIALDNLTVTLERLRTLLVAGGLQMKDILEIEKEMTRLRGEIERIKGEKRFLEDRVSLATVNVELSRRAGAVMSPRAKVYPGPRFAVLTLFGAGDRKQTRLGGGVAMHIAMPRLTLELDIFDDVEADGDQPRESHAAIATWGGAMYSDFLGRGEREMFNPYIGFRIGYGYLDYHAFVVQREVGLELYKQTHMLIDASVQATGFLGEDNVDAGLVSAVSAVFAF